MVCAPLLAAGASRDTEESSVHTLRVPSTVLATEYALTVGATAIVDLKVQPAFRPFVRATAPSMVSV